MGTRHTNPPQDDPPVAGLAMPAPAVGSRSTALRIGVFVLVTAGVGLLLALDSVWEAGYVYAAGGAAVVALAMAELADLAGRTGVRVSRTVLVLGGVALFLVQWAGWAWRLPDPWLTAAAMPVLVALAVLCSRVLRAEVPGALESMAVTAAGLLYVPVLLGFLTAIRAEWGVPGLLTVLVVCKTGTSGAYVVGKAIGRTRLSPTVSPSKTVEGAVGQFAGGMAAALAMCYSPWALMGPGIALAYGALTAGAGILGDLAESLLKRQAAMKDSSQLIPALGGMLDTIDDMVFVAPVSYFFLHLCARVAQGG